jgi:hypothetical protein
VAIARQIGVRSDAHASECRASRACLIAAAAAAPSTDPKLRALVEHTRQGLESTHLAGTRIVDIATDHPLGAIVLDRNHLFLTAADAPILHTFPLARVHERVGGALAMTDGQRGALPHPAQPHLTTVISGRVASIHYAAEDHADVGAPSEMVPLQGLSERPMRLFAPLSDGRWRILQAGGAYHVLDAASLRIDAQIARDEVAARCAAAAGVAIAAPDLAQGVFIGSIFFLPLFTRISHDMEQFVGVAELDLPTFGVRSVRRFSLPAGIETTSGPNTLIPTERGHRVIAMMPTRESIRVFLVDLVATAEMVGQPEIPSRLEIWELRQSAPAQRVGMRGLRITTLLGAFTFEELRTTRSDLVPTLHDVVPVPPTTLLLNIVGDSVYAFDIDQGTFRVMLHPGNGQLTFATNGSGVAALFGQGWNHAVVFFCPSAEAAISTHRETGAITRAHDRSSRAS